MTVLALQVSLASDSRPSPLTLQVLALTPCLDIAFYQSGDSTCEVTTLQRDWNVYIIIMMMIIIIMTTWCLSDGRDAAMGDFKNISDFVLRRDSALAPNSH